MISPQQQAFNKRKATIYSKQDFHTRVYGLASPERIEYGIPGELHQELEERVGIKGAMQTSSAIQEGWVRFSSRFDELEMHCIPNRTALRSVHNLVVNIKAERCLLDLEDLQGKHTLHEFETTEDLLNWVGTHFSQ